MKKLILIVLLIVSLIGCRDPLHGGGFVTDKGVDYIDVQAMLDGFGIKESGKGEKNIIEMYWIKINTCEDKIYINLFSWEDTEINEFILIGPEHSDDRFVTEY
jgi:hypothetical protein